jgi:uncharacterized membrane protein
MQTQATITIDRPVQDVWDYLDDHRNDLVWRRPNTQKLEQVGTGPVVIGTRFEGVITVIGPKQYPYVNEITAYEPPNHVAWKAISSAGWVIGRKGSYTLEADGDRRTRMIFSITMEPITFAGKLVAPLMNPMGPNLIMPLLKQLKEALEQQRSAAPSPER